MKRSILLILAAAALAQETYKPTEPEIESIRGRSSELRQMLAKVRANDELRADVEIYLKAANWILRHPEEFYKRDYLVNTLAVLDRGIARADQLAAGKPEWPKAKGRISRAYRSRIDGSVQPYGLLIPDSYDGSRPVRLDVVLHGRAATMNEVSFLASHDSAKPLPPEQDYITLEVFGRTNNAYRWAGETDVFEALDSVRARYNIDANRIVLRGFSMGGAGAWHIGLHYPDRWAAVEAGAGFAETRTYAKLSNVPDYQAGPLHIYDAADYAVNAVNVPIVGYGGDQDPQLRASQVIQERLAGVPGLRALFLVGQKTGHKWQPDSLKESNAFIDAAVAEGRRTPDRIRFVTYTTRYNRCFWLTVDALEKHYERAEVEGNREELKTTNVTALSLETPGSPVIDGQKPGRGSSFVKQDGKWRVGRMEGIHKRQGLQGPIDDAFMDSFLVAGDVPERVAREWAKWMRGDLRVKSPSAVSSVDIKQHNLILFGTAETNPLIRRIQGKLPKRDVPAGHRLVMIYPNPLNPSKYVVLNSGHTFGEREFRGTNALLFPRFGDWAVVKDSDGAIVEAGLFNDRWEF